MTITILSRDIQSGGGITPDIWRFHVSAADAAVVASNHLSFTLYTAALSGPYHPSLSASPWSELYTSSTMDPYPLVWDVVDNGGGDWSINFIKELGNPKFGLFSFSSWYGFEATGATGGTGSATSSIPTFAKDLREIKCRSPYLYITPDTQSGTCSTYVMATGLTAGYFGYQSAETGEMVTKYVAANDAVMSYCAVPGTFIGPSGSTVTFDNNCDPQFLYDKAYFTIKEWNNDINTIPTAISYYKTKQKVVSIQDDIYINLSNILKEGLEGDIVNYAIYNNPTQSQNIGINESKWAYVKSEFSLYGATISSAYQNDYFFVVDGYTEPGEDQGFIRPFTPGWQQRVLMTDWNRRTYTQFTHQRIHFTTNNLNSIDSYVGNVYPGATTSTPISFTANPAISNQYIQSILVDTVQNMTYVFNYVSGSEIVWTYVTPYDCKYDRYDIVFKNKWGVLESISANKKSIKNLSVENSEFLRGIVDYNGSYNVSRHTQKHFNTTGYQEWTLNTDFIPEYMNVTIQEMLLSEEVWLIDRWNTITPVLRVDGSLTYKTLVNDKLIQYTFKVKVSQAIINNII